jgi:hypothetical protein
MTVMTAAAPDVELASSFDYDRVRNVSSDPA